MSDDRTVSTPIEGAIEDAYAPMMVPEEPPTNMDADGASPGGRQD